MEFHKPKNIKCTQSQLDQLYNGLNRPPIGEFNNALYFCDEKGLNPFLNEVVFIEYGNKIQKIVTIDGYRLAASSTGESLGHGVSLTYINGKVTGAKAWAKRWIQKANQVASFEVEVLLSEYDTGRNMWKKMPATMIKKVAESHVLRMAFPDKLGGTYTQEEMDQAKKTDREEFKQANPETQKKRGPRQLNFDDPEINTRLETIRKLLNDNGLSPVSERIRPYYEAIREAHQDQTDLEKMDNLETIFKNMEVEIATIASEKQVKAEAAELFEKELAKA